MDDVPSGFAAVTVAEMDAWMAGDRFAAAGWSRAKDRGFYPEATMNGQPFLVVDLPPRSPRSTSLVGDPTTCGDGCDILHDGISVRRVAEPPGLLSEAEHRAMDLTVELVNLVARSVVGPGASRDGDLAELVHYVHGIQNMILAQAASRAFPNRYRLLGSVVDG